MLCAIDFEYNTTSETKLNLVCVAWSVDRGPAQTLWLHNHNENKLKLKEILLGLAAKECSFICFNASAEARSFLSLDIDPIKCKWVDLQCEWKMITNHFTTYRHGKQLINGKEKFTTVKRYYGNKRPGNSHDRPDMSLVAMTYKLLGIQEDLVYKNRIRNFIIHAKEFPLAKQKEILTYCAGDIKDLFGLMDEIFKIYNNPKFPVRRMSKGKIIKEVLYRGTCGARTAVMEAIGIPVNVERVTTLAHNVQNIMDECAKEILEAFPEVEPFVWNKKDKRYSKKEKNIKQFIADSPYGPKWEKTAGGAISLKLDAFTDRFNFGHEYPKDNLFAQMIRYLKIGRSFNGLKIKKSDLVDVTEKKKANVFDSLGKDGRIKPYLNIYGAQSARFQPKATTFPFLWAAWIRAIVEPKPGKYICGIDYSSQEFLISALLSTDDVMLEAYKSGDPYMYLGKKSGLIPPDGTRKKYAKERDIFKTVTLGISYGMGPGRLSHDLTAKTGEEFTEERAIDLIDTFFMVYPKYKIFTDFIRESYQDNAAIKLVDGWYMFGDNPNSKSIGNMPIQGMGSCILRKAIEFCQDAGLQVIFPLHDALYCELSTLEEVDLFYDKMREAFIHFFKDKEGAGAIRSDIDLWGPTLKDEYIKTPQNRDIKSQQIYIDPRAVNEYNLFKKYFTNKV